MYLKIDLLDHYHNLYLWFEWMRCKVCLLSLRFCHVSILYFSVAVISFFFFFSFPFFFGNAFLLLVFLVGFAFLSVVSHIPSSLWLGFSSSGFQSLDLTFDRLSFSSLSIAVDGTLLSFHRLLVFVTNDSVLSLTFLLFITHTRDYAETNPPSAYPQQIAE